VASRTSAPEGSPRPVAPAEPAPEISVVVSTLNRARGLAELFDALRNQTLQGRVQWELIVVDNGSSDDTARFLDASAARGDLPLVGALEPRRGKSHGLNTGIALARADIVALTDDDGIPAADWLERLLWHFQEHPEVACVGGRVALYDPADASISVRLSAQPMSVDASTFAPSNIPVIGCNMAIRASVLRQIGSYDPAIGPGSRVGVAEDVDMLYRIVRAGHRIDYDPRIVVLHNHGRRAAEEIEGVTRGYAMGRGAFYCKHALKADRTALRYAYWEFRSLLLEMLRGKLVGTRASGARRQTALMLTGASRYIRFRGGDHDRKP
jgi:glycosyltransferase involved in cell wall biosynthesis